MKTKTMGEEVYVVAKYDYVAQDDKVGTAFYTRVTCYLPRGGIEFMTICLSASLSAGLHRYFRLDLHDKIEKIGSGLRSH